MTEVETLELPALKPKVKVASAIRKKAKEQFQEEAQVIVHCSFTAKYGRQGIRIWESTFLFAKESNHCSKLVHYENITCYPTWTYVESKQTHFFTLVFTGLPKSCSHFDMIEKIPEPGGFQFRKIERNNLDVYSIEIK